MDFIKEIESAIDGDEKAKENLEIFEMKARKKILLEKKHNVDKDDSDNDDTDDMVLAEDGNQIRKVADGDEGDMVLAKDVNQIRKVADGVEGEGCQYFEHCSKEKLKTMCKWFKHILQNKDMQLILQKKNPEEYVNVKQMWKPIKLAMRVLADPEQPLHKKRKILLKPQVGEGILTPMRKLVIPLIKYMLRQRQF
jgi:hypothetical protein